MVAPERRRSRRVVPSSDDPIRVELRCGEGSRALEVAAFDIAIHGLGLQLDPADLENLEEGRGLDVEFVLPGQLDRIGLPVEIRQCRDVEDRAHVGLEFCFEDAEQQDWATSRVAEYVAARIAGSELLGRVA